MGAVGAVVVVEVVVVVVMGKEHMAVEGVVEVHRVVHRKVV